MNKAGFVLIGVGLIFFIYAFICKNDVSIYNRSDRFVIINEKNFYKLQFYISLLNSIGLMIFGIMTIIYDISNIFVVFSPCVFHIINSTLFIVSRRKNYIEYKITQ